MGEEAGGGSRESGAREFEKGGAAVASAACTGKYGGVTGESVATWFARLNCGWCGTRYVDAAAVATPPELR